MQNGAFLPPILDKEVSYRDPAHPADISADNCDFNGENCTLLETTLVNLAPGNSGSLTAISLIPPHKFSVPTGFQSVFDPDLSLP